MAAAPRAVGVVLALLAAAASLAAAKHVHEHDCIHDTIMHARRHADEPRQLNVTYDPVWELDASGNPARALAATYGSIRIYVDVTKLSNDPNFLCQYSGQTVLASIPISGVTTETHTCTGGDVLTPEKKNFLINTVIVDTVAYFSRVLSVLPVKNNLVLRTPDDSYCRYMHVECCKKYMSSIAYTTGYASTDFVLFATARPTTGSTVAWALPCQSDSIGRPIAGHANFGPALIDTATSAVRSYLHVARHEITHALGFTASKFPDFVQPGTSTLIGYSNVVRGFKERGQGVTSPAVYKIVTPNVVAKVKQQFDCSDWLSAGAELENWGDTGSAGSHWEKRLFMNEYMTATVNALPAVFSSITLALLQDSGWYQVDYTAADTLNWGNGLGCSFASGYCSGWPSSYFCTTQAPGCFPGRAFRGYCNVYPQDSPLPTPFQYFPNNPNLGGRDDVSDYCPYFAVSQGNDCRDSTIRVSGVYGELASLSSRCFSGTFVTSNVAGTTYAQQHAACLATDCTPGNLLVIKFKKSDGTFASLTCPKDGGNVDVAVAMPGAGFVGTIACPPAREICTGNPCDTNLCDGHGSCAPADGTCTCNAGYYGADAYHCDKITCPNSAGATAPCSGHGTCISDINQANSGQCVCNVGYRGSTCSELGCPQGPARTVCDTASPPHCTTQAVDCDGHGTCDGSGVCHCDAGYLGAACTKKACPVFNGNTCGGTDGSTGLTRGVCDTSNGYCQCTWIETPVNGSMATTSYYSTPSCGTLSTGNPVQQLYFSGEPLPAGATGPTSGGKVVATTVSLQAQEYGYFSFVVPSVKYKQDLTLTYTSGTPEMTASYSDHGTPTVSQADFFVTSNDVNAKTKTISFTPVSGSVTSARFTAVGTMVVAVVSPDPTSFSLTLTRDPCSTLACVHGTCTGGRCLCDRPPPVGGGKYGTWAGSLCEIPDCPGTPDCGDFRGTCVVDKSQSLHNQFPICQCSTGFSGVACADTSTSGFKEVNATSVKGYSYSGTVQVGANATFFMTVPARYGIYAKLMSKSAGADPMLLGRNGGLPPLARDASTAFDTQAWATGGNNHTISVTTTALGIYFLQVLNGRYATGPMSYDLLIQVAPSCPAALANCHGHGTCSGYCLCDDGWEGVDCSLSVPSVSTRSMTPLTNLAVGEWKYYVFKSAATDREVFITLSGFTPRTPGLLMVGVASQRRANNLKIVTDENALFDYDSFASGAASQTVHITRTGFAYYYIGVHTARFARGPGTYTLNVTSASGSTFKTTGCLASASAQADCAAKLCNGRGVYAQDSTGQPFCICQSGWAPETFCRTPRFSSFVLLPSAAQSIQFLCNLCDYELDLAPNQLVVYKIPQPLQRSTGLTLSVHATNASQRGNPSLLVSSRLPRSLSDFTFVVSSNSANQTLTIEEQSPTGQYWMAVYANTPATYRISANRATLPGQVILADSFFTQLWQWMSTTQLGMVSSIVAGAVILCLCGGCIWQVCSVGAKKAAQEITHNIEDVGAGMMASVRALPHVNESMRASFRGPVATAAVAGRPAPPPGPAPTRDQDAEMRLAIELSRIAAMSAPRPASPATPQSYSSHRPSMGGVGGGGAPSQRPQPPPAGPVAYASVPMASPPMSPPMASPAVSPSMVQRNSYAPVSPHVAYAQAYAPQQQRAYGAYSPQSPRGGSYAQPPMGRGGYPQPPPPEYHS